MKTFGKLPARALPRALPRALFCALFCVLFCVLFCALLCAPISAAPAEDGPVTPVWGESGAVLELPETTLLYFRIGLSKKLAPAGNFQSAEQLAAKGLPGEAAAAANGHFYINSYPLSDYAGATGSQYAFMLHIEKSGGNSYLTVVWSPEALPGCGRDDRIEFGCDGEMLSVEGIKFAPFTALWDPEKGVLTVSEGFTPAEQPDEPEPDASPAGTKSPALPAAVYICAGAAGIFLLGGAALFVLFWPKKKRAALLSGLCGIFLAAGAVLLSLFALRAGRGGETDFFQAYAASQYVEVDAALPVFDAGMKTAKVERKDGVTRLYVDGTPVAPILFFGNSDMGNPENVTTDQAALAAAAGVHFHSLIVNLNYTADLGSKNPVVQKLIYNQVDKSIESILDGDPDALILLRVSVLMPASAAENEGDIITFKNGEKSGFVSIASEAFNRESSIRLAHLTDYISSHPVFAKHVIGYHLDHQEWFQIQYREKGQDYSPANSAGFAAWCRKKYGGDAALSEAWGEPRTLAGVLVPEDLPANLYSEQADGTLFYEGGDDTRFADYHRYISDLTAARISNLSKIIKERTAGRAFVIAFYGYHFELFSALSGHYSLEALLKDPYIDGFAAPVSYKDRISGGYPPGNALGATSSYMSTVDSIQRAGKLWFQESDQRTYLNRTGVPDDFIPKLETLEDILSVHRRELGDSLIHGNGLWAMDLWARGWLDDPLIWENISAMKELCLAYQNSAPAPEFDVALVVDEGAMARMVNHVALGSELLGAMQQNLYHAGLSVGYFQLSDVLAGRADDAKLYIFATPFDIGKEDAQKLAVCLHRDGKTALFMYNFGVTPLAYAKILTGMDFAAADGPGDTGLMISENSPIDLKWENFSAATSRRMYVSGGQSAVLGTYSDGTAGFAMYEGTDFKTIYYGNSLISIENLRAIAAYCGVHVFSSGGDVLSANKNLVMFHASGSGEKTLVFPSGADVYDYFEGRWYESPGELSFEAELGLTKLFFYGEAAQIESWLLPAWE